MRGACSGEDPELFFAPEGARGADRWSYEVDAKAICAECPVVAQCLEYALEHRMDGVWGGTNEAERRELRRQPSTRAAS